MPEENRPEVDEDEDVPLASHHKEGKGCFLVLIVISAIPVIFFLITFAGGDFLTYVYMRNWVTDHALMRRMPVTMPSTEKEEVRRLLDQFYDAGRSGKIPATYVIDLSSDYKEMMSYPGDVRREALEPLLLKARKYMVKFDVVPSGSLPGTPGEKPRTGSGPKP